MIYGFLIPFRLPSLNEYINVCRANKFKAAEYKKAIEDEIMLFARVQPIRKPVEILFEWYEPNEKRDPDNIAFAKKFILDALVKKGILPNDNMKYIKGLADSFYVGSKGEVIVQITEKG